MSKRCFTIGGLTGLAVLVLACAPEGPMRPHTALGPDAAGLRDAFNADAGSVRVVLLVAPT